MLGRIAEDFRFAGGRAWIGRRTGRWLDLKLEYREVTLRCGHRNGRRKEKRINVESDNIFEKEVQLSLKFTEMLTIAQIQ
jgi:hypothetical protein